MLSKQLFLKLLGLFLLLPFASCASKGPSDGYDSYEGMAVRDKYVYWISCREYNSENLTMPCRVFRESLYEKNDRKICNLELRGKRIRYFQALSKDLVTLSWYAHYNSDFHLTISTLNFNTCKGANAQIDPTVSLQFVNDYSRLNATTFSSSNGKIQTVFDIPKACGATLCQLTFYADAKGAKLTNFFEGVFKKSTSVYRVIKLDYDKEIYLVIEKAGVLEYSLLTANGKKALTEYDISSNLAQSTTYQKIRFCQKVNGQNALYCNAFDVNSGEPDSNVTVSLSHEAHDQIFEVENLPGGKFLLFTNSKNLEKSYVTKVASDGKNLGTFQLTGVPKCKSSWCLNKGELKILNNKYCRSFLRMTLNDFEYGRKCFSDDDFE